MTSTRQPGTRLNVDELEGREVPAILFGVTPANQLVEFDSANVGTLLRVVQIGGFVAPGELITDIDVRPNTGNLYGHSTFGRLFLINPISGFAIPVSNLTTQTVPNIGLDIDPATDRIRILSNKADNMVVDPAIGSLIRTGTALAYAPNDPAAGIAPHITGAAFSNNVPGSTSRTLYAIDHKLNTLVRVGQVILNDGVLTTIGSLGIDVTNNVGFDIAPQSNVAFASLQKPGQSFSKLFVINTATGQATRIGPIGGGILVSDIAVDTNGTTGFVSTAGFGAVVPQFPTSGINLNTGTSNFGFNTGGFNDFGFNNFGFTSFGTNSFSSFNLISPLGAPITSTDLFPTLVQPMSGTLTMPFTFTGSTLPTNTANTIF